jgi:amino acid transporter
MATTLEPFTRHRTKVVVATSVMLSFISFWRAAAIVLNDLGSSAYYVGGIAEQAVGRAAPWFILGVMLFSYAVRSVYIESCAMFTRGGVYRVVKESMGGTLAKLSVSALMFDYILTGPISGVSAGQYIVGLAAQTATYFGHPWSPSKGTINILAAGFAILITLYFWWRNTQGIHESSDDALKIMYVTTAMVVLLLVWSGLTILTRPNAQKLPPSPAPRNLVFNRDAVGWMPKLAPGSLQESPQGASSTASEQSSEPRYVLSAKAGMFIGLIGILMAFGHSVLAMSGEETLAQVNREIEYPKHKNLMRAGLVIFVYSMLFTSLVSFLAYAIIPDSVRSQYFDNLISGISIYLIGPTSLKLLFQAFIVIVGFLMLAGAVNTAIIGSNGVLNRVSEDGVMTDWFRAPHRRFGTTYRMINLIVVLQLLTIIGSRGNVYVLGEAYAFGVVWSFAFKALAVLVLRFKDKSEREWKVPFNLKLDGIELPLGLGIITAMLFSVAGINLLTKQIATVSGIAFTLVFFAIFLVSERINERKRGAAPHVEMDQFRLNMQDVISTETLAVRPGNALCLVRDYNTLGHVAKALELTHTGKRNLVVMTVRLLRGPDTGYENMAENQLFTSYEQLLFSKVVALAEKAGKHVDLLVVPAADIFYAIAQTAAHLDSADIWAGRSSVMLPQQQARRLGEAWEGLPERSGRQISFHVVETDGRLDDFYLGAHAPELSEQDIDLLHSLWLDATQERGIGHIRHKEIVTIALQRIADQMRGNSRGEVLNIMREVAGHRDHDHPDPDEEKHVPQRAHEHSAADESEDRGGKLLDRGPRSVSIPAPQPLAPVQPALVCAPAQAENESALVAVEVSVETENGFRITRKPEFKPESGNAPGKYQFVVYDPTGQAREVAVDVAKDAMTTVLRRSQNRISPLNSYWVYCAERHLARYLWEEGECPPYGKLIVDRLSANDLGLVARWGGN